MEPVVGVDPERFRKAVTVLICCTSVICLSAGLINFNKYILGEGVYPYPIALTTMHMVACSVFCTLCYGLRGESWFPSSGKVSAELGTYLWRTLPIAVCFAFSIWLSNVAYLYSSVAFLQMCKEANIVMVYSLSLLMGLDTFRGYTFAILSFILLGCVISVTGEIKFSKIGLLVQVSSQVFEVTKVITQQYVMQGFKVDPLTMVWLMSPLCAIGLGSALWFRYQPGMIADARANWVLLSLNCCVAFALNVAIAFLIKHADGVAAILSGVIKDVAIVTVAALYFGAGVTHIQCVGFSMAVVGVATHGLTKLFPERTKERGVFSTLGFVLCGFEHLPCISVKGTATRDLDA
jgi:hypothetical protein